MSVSYLTTVDGEWNIYTEAEPTADNGQIISDGQYKARKRCSKEHIDGGKRCVG